MKPSRKPALQLGFRARWRMSLGRIRSPPFAQRRRWIRREPKSGGETLRVVIEPPTPGDQIDRRFSVFDDSAVLNETSDRVASFDCRFSDIFQRGLPNKRVGAHPEGRPIRCEPLMDEVL